MVNVVHVGLGPIGIEIARLASNRGFRTRGAVDPAPALAGSRLSEHTGEDAHSDVEVVPALGGYQADVALHSTGSALARVEEQILELVQAGLNVVSTCEELSYPWWRSDATARSLDEAARRSGVTVLGTGINPGYAMDYLPLALAAPCQSVEGIRVHRVQDAAQRRIPLQRKVGAGLSEEEFMARVAEGGLGHVGLEESARQVAAALGWADEIQIDESIGPVLADEEIIAAIGRIQAGRVRGIHQVVEGFLGDRRVIEMTLDMALGVADPRDVVVIDGNPNLQATIAGGIHGDVGTAAMVVNSIQGVLSSPPGLLVSSQLSPVQLLRREYC